MGSTTSVGNTTINPADSLLGQLQRGRGLGYLRALQEKPSSVHPLLVECITRDPRLDTQVETRAGYYARLCASTQIDISPIGEYLSTNPGDHLDSEALLAVATLGVLAQLGDNSTGLSAAAIAILRDYVAYGVKWDAALQQLAELPEEAATEGLAHVLCARFETGVHMEAASVYGLFSDPALNTLWDRWERQHECITRLLGAAREEMRSWESHRQRVAQPDYKTMSVEELLTTVDARNRRHIEKILLSRLRHSEVPLYAAALNGDNVFAWYVAFQCLAALRRAGDFYALAIQKATSFVGSAEISGVRGPKLGAIKRLLNELPPETTLPLARQWFDSPIWQVQLIGRGILEEHATTEDLPRLRTFISDELGRGDPREVDVYGVCSALDALSHLPNIGQLPEVEAAYAESAYSFARLRAAKAMRENAPVWFSETYAVECMWDCEEEARGLGCESVSLRYPDAIERLQAIVDDTSEDQYVREKAAERLQP